MLNGKGLDERTSLFKAMREKEQELITTLGRENLKTLGLRRVSKALTVTDVLNGQDEAAATQNAEVMQ